jgi:hypothetical protein
MTLVEAIDEYFRGLAQDGSPSQHSHRDSLELLRRYLATEKEIPARLEAPVLRDFLARWCIEQGGWNRATAAVVVLESVAGFLTWLDSRLDTAVDPECASLVEELTNTLPQAVEISAALSSHLAVRGGAFSFPEFLTTFADGGQSQYDIDVAGEGGGPGAIEGYFRVMRVEGTSAEVEEVISEERSWPLLLPEEIARLIKPGYIINLEIIRNTEGWAIAACGFAYPPGTAV